MTPGPAPRRVHVRAASRTYDVVVGRGLLAGDETGLGAMTRATVGPSPRRAMLIVDDGVPPDKIDAAKHSLTSEPSGFDVRVVTLHPTEPDKSLATLDHLLRELAASRHERHEPVVALGGGIVGDIAGFAAATYRRGVPVVQCPTTLLAMVDASVGGKTGVNLPTPDGASLLKNMVGAFHQPTLVVADVETLASLDERDFRSGLAECVKHGLLAGPWGDPDLFDWIEQHADSILARDADTLVELVTRNVAVKAAVVEADEREDTSADAGRMLLNLGHTFAHALEPMKTVQGVVENDWLAERPAGLTHGEAVALGLVLAARTGADPRVGLCDAGLVERVTSLLSALGLPTGVAIGGADAGTPASILAAMGDDKKTRGGGLTLVLPRSPLGASTVVRGGDANDLASAARDSLRVSIGV